MLSYQQAKDIEDALGPQQAAPIIAALEGLDRKIEQQRTALKEDLLLELATKADIANLRTELKEDMANLRAELKEDIANLRAELKQDIGSLRHELTTSFAFLNNKIDTEIAKVYLEIAKIHGEFKSIRLWMKLLVAIGILGMTFFSPTTIKLLEMLK